MHPDRQEPAGRVDGRALGVYPILGENRLEPPGGDVEEDARPVADGQELVPEELERFEVAEVDAFGASHRAAVGEVEDAPDVPVTGPYRQQRVGGVEGEVV